MQENIKKLEDLKKKINQLEIPNWLIGQSESTSTTIVQIETRRQFDNLYKTLNSAHFNLAMSCLPDYCSFIETTNPLYIRELFTRSAILWYNSSFDMLLQSVWLYYRIYKTILPNTKLTNKGLVEILSACRYNDIVNAVNNGICNIDKELYDSIIALRNRMNPITSWANALKHRGNFEFRELPFRSSIPRKVVDFKKGDNIIKILQAPIIYDTSKTFKKESIYKVITSLINYHKNISDTSKLLVEKINV